MKFVRTGWIHCRVRENVISGINMKETYISMSVYFVLKISFVRNM